MNDETLRTLLSRADRLSTMETIDPAALRRRADVRQRRRRTLLVAIIALFSLALLWQPSHRPVAPLAHSPAVPSPGIVATSPASPDVPSEIVLQASFLLAKAHADLPLNRWPDPALSRESAAQTLLLSAQRSLHAGHIPDAAKRMHDIVALFPETTAAGAARQALDHLPPPNTISSKEIV